MTSRRPSIRPAHRPKKIAARHLPDGAGEMRALRERLVLLRQTGDKQAECGVLLKLGELCHRGGDAGQANEYFAQGLDLARALGDDPSQGLAFYGLGTTFGDLDLCTLAYQRALPFLEEAGHHQKLASALSNLGNLLTEDDRAREALPFLQQAVAVSRDLDDPQLQALAHLNLGMAYRKQGDHENSIASFHEAQALAGRHGNHQMERLALQLSLEARADEQGPHMAAATWN